MSLSEIAKGISASPTLALNAKAAMLKEKGNPVIHLGGGEPKCKVPIEAVTAVEEHLHTREVRYTAVGGILPLKNAVIQYTEKYYNHTVSPKNILISNGAKQAIMAAMLAVLNPGDEMLYPAPFWVSYPDMTALCGAKGTAVFPSDGSFYPKIEDFEKHISRNTKAILINSPNNPSGAVYSEQFISDIVSFCEKRELYLIMDDIYHRLIFDDRNPVSCYDYAQDLSENSKLIVVNGVSKAYAMTGFRIGWAAANKKLIEAMTNIQAHQTSCPSVLLQKATLGALNGIQSSVESLRTSLENNRNVLIDELKSINGINVTIPDGTFYCLPDFSSYMKDSTELSNFLVDKVQVLTMPGIEFGMEGYLRLSYCGCVEDITEGIKRIKWALDPGSSGEIYIGGRKVMRDWAEPALC